MAPGGSFFQLQNITNMQTIDVEPHPNFPSGHVANIRKEVGCAESNNRILNSEILPSRNCN